jgi:hypothetical protein
VIAALLASCPGCRAPERDRTRGSDNPMIANSMNILQTSKDPDELVSAALSLARGPEAEGHAALSKQFQSAEF